MYMQGTLRGAACALLMMVWLGLGSASGADFSAAEIVASGGTQKSHVTCSSSQTSTSSGKIKNLSGQTCVSISSAADTDPGVNYIQIQADEGYTIDNSLVITGAAGGSSDKNAVVLMWRGAYSATTADTCFSVLTPENDSGTRDTIALRFPSGRFRTIRIYRRINYNEGTIGSSATGSSHQIPSSNASSFVVKDISATATAAVTTKMVYLNPNEYANWSKGDERYAVYGWNATGNAWYDMTPISDGCGGTIYKAEVSLDYTGLIFCRMNGATTENNWGNKWDQTYDVTAANGCYCKITGVSGDPQKATYTYENKPFEVCVSGTWLRFTGETISLTATSAGATHFQWYKGGVEESNKIDGATSATFTKTNCTHADAGSYYCKAWSVEGDGNATWSGVFDVKIPILIIQTPPATPGDISGDRQEVALTRASESDEVVTCGIYLGVAWTYEFVIDDGFKTYGTRER